MDQHVDCSEQIMDFDLRTQLHAAFKLQSSRLFEIAMPLPYSIDFRWRIIWLTLILRTSPADVAKKLNVSRCTVFRYVDLFQQTGDVMPRAHRHGPTR